MLPVLIKAFILQSIVLATGVLAHETARFEKLSQAYLALNAFDANDYPEKALNLNSKITKEELKHSLAIIDPSSQLKHYTDITDGQITVYKDKNSKRLQDYAIRLATQDSPEKFSDEKPKPPCSPDQELSGLRIALDPGHTGLEYWDQYNGKFVGDGRHLILEGDLALKTVLVLAESLERNGAEVFLTRETNRLVTDRPIEFYDTLNEAKNVFRNSTDESWFENFLGATPLQMISKKIMELEKIKSIFSSDRKQIYYLTKEDLAARADKINSVKPDLTLIVHYDSHGTTPQNTLNGVMTFVAGNIMTGELSSPQQRFTTLERVVHYKQLMQSIVLSKQIVGSLSSSTGVPLYTESKSPAWKFLSDGVFARNLTLTRNISSGLVSYLEVMRYDDRKEFHRLANETETLCFRGNCILYSKRINDVSVGILSGIKQYYCK